MQNIRYKPLRLYIGTLLLQTHFLQALPIPKQVDDILRYEEQKKIYEEQTKARETPEAIYTELTPIPLSQESNATQACIRIESIDTTEITLIDKEVLEALKEPYLHRCDTMHDINTLVKKINNIYIEKAYITSRAYIKLQDLSEGHLVIAAMEGKVESVRGNNISTGLVFPFIKNEFLNLRDLETGLEQLNRLQSMQATMSINPGKEEGFSQVEIKGKKIGSALHGSLGANNYGTVKSGKYQFSGSVGWDNPLGINDLLTLNLNTTDKQDSDNNSLGNSISYGLPVGRAYLEFIYSRFEYDQIVNGLNREYLSNGESEAFQIRSEYKLFHTKTQRGKFDLSLLRKENDNYLAGVYLDTSSSTLTILQLSYTHHYSGAAWDGYATLKYHRGLDWMGAKTGSLADATFDKTTLDLSYSKQYKNAFLPLFYHFSFYGQYAQQGIVGSEQIGIGGPYSVRGFENESQISGNRGFYLRNELATHKAYAKGTVSPYLALDYGVVSRNEESYGGHIVGAAVGCRVTFDQWSLDLSRSFPLIDSNEVTYATNGDEIRKTNDGLTGFSLSYRF
ncbi:ShlB/FhaC/HecB family hemolysin secretion/activation protein [Sulfurovum sp. TSL1]|uniref:ShlB/FhaC/HecB family hemolysin secretion/activation protein n=1 Tax=Sulfurovum sp. TSL1 TaxID=2826994 RepID=UPI001CC39BD3|nr:ShlB/FhaC/HecB family hemolysin secretion/activation protein [Sulfurovum sp. TSL1]GIT98152.1 peptide transporter [Sulfurovum sp. TSL1]